VQNLKQKIQDSKPDFSVDKQKLIHSGKVLKDSQTIAEIGMKDTDFIVCMVSKEAAAKVSLS
jgi:UV excision repair protein RAD23